MLRVNRTISDVARQKRRQRQTISRLRQQDASRSTSPTPNVATTSATTASEASRPPVATTSSEHHNHRDHHLGSPLHATPRKLSVQSCRSDRPDPGDFDSPARHDSVELVKESSTVDTIVEVATPDLATCDLATTNCDPVILDPSKVAPKADLSEMSNSSDDVDHIRLTKSMVRIDVTGAEHQVSA